MFQRMKKLLINVLAALVFGVLLLSPVMAQSQWIPVTPESTPAPVEVETPAPVVVPVEIRDTGSELAITSIALFAGVALIAFGVFAGVVIRYVANLIPPEFAGTVYSTGNAFYSKRQQFIEQKRAEALKNNVQFDDLFWDAAMTVSAKDWQQFIDEAAKKGVVLQPIKKE